MTPIYGLKSVVFNNNEIRMIRPLISSNTIRFETESPMQQNYVSNIQIKNILNHVEVFNAEVRIAGCLGIINYTPTI